MKDTFNYLIPRNWHNHHSSYYHVSSSTYSDNQDTAIGQIIDWMEDISIIYFVLSLIVLFIPEKIKNRVKNFISNLLSYKDPVKGRHSIIVVQAIANSYRFFYWSEYNATSQTMSIPTAVMQRVSYLYILDSRNGKSAPWMYKNSNTGSTLMNCYIGKVNTAWTKAIGAYNVYDLYQRGLYNTTDTYTFSSYAKIDGNVQLRSGDIAFYSTATDSNGAKVDVSKVNSNTWTQISVSFKFSSATPPQNSGGATLRFEPNVSWDGSGSHAGVGKGYLYLACPQLEKGPKASDYHPAPEDDYSMIQQMQSQITTLTQQITSLQKTTTN